MCEAHVFIENDRKISPMMRDEVYGLQEELVVKECLVRPDAQRRSQHVCQIGL